MSFSPVRIDGGGLAQVLDISAGGVLVIGSDTQGAYRSASSPYGNDWLVRNKGIGASTFYRQMATVLWSKRETGICYAGTGDNGTKGGLLVWSESSKKWSLRSGVPGWAGNHPGSSDPVPQFNWSRPTGRLLVQDAGSDFLFAGTYKQGVLQSANNGNDGFPVVCQMAGVTPNPGDYFCYAITQVPGTPTTIYGCFYHSDGSSAVWKCTNAHAATPNFTKLAGSPTDAQDIIVLANGSIYVVAGNNGLYRSATSADTTWTAINGGTPTQAGGGLDTSAGNSWWNTLDAYTDGSGNDQVLVGCGNPIKPSGAASYACIAQVSVTNPAGTPSFANLTTTGNVQTTTMPPGNIHWWHAGSSIAMGGAGFVNPQVRWDPNDATHQKIYVSASQGLYRTVNGGTNWTIASAGMPQFLAHSVAVAPNKTVGFCDSDWCVFELTDADGHTGTGTYNNSPFHGEGWGITYAPDSTAYLSTGAKYTNSQGEVWTHPPGQPGGTWVKTGFGNSLANGGAGGKVAIGLAAFNDAAGKQILVAAAWSGGVWRYAPTGPGGAYQWTQVNATIGTSVPIPGNQIPVIYAGNGLLYCFDRPTGIWRSSDYGLTWGSAPIWAKTTNDPDAGTIAAHPTVAGELWVSAGTGLFQLLGANTGTVSGGGITVHGPNANLPGKAGPVAFDGSGNLICATQDTGSGSGLVTSPDHGATWADVVGDDSFAQCNCNPEFIAIGPDSRIYVSGSNVVATGTASTGGGQGVSAAFTERQQSANILGAGGQLPLWFSETSGGPGPGGTGAPSLPGSMLSARIETTDGTAVITAPPGWTLRVDVAAANTTGTARVLIYDYLNSPGGLGGPASAPMAIPPGLRSAAALTAGPGLTGGTVISGGVAAPGTALRGPSIAGGPAVAPGDTVFSSSSLATIKGKLFEYTTPPGTVQFYDQSGSASAQASTTSEVVTATAANTLTGGLGVVAGAENLSVTGSGGGHTTPSGWTSDGSVNNQTLNFSTYYNAALTAGPTPVTIAVNAGTGATMAAWAAALATYYALASSPVQVTTPPSTLRNSWPGTLYAVSLAASGGVAPYTWAVTGGTLPPGLSLSSGGFLSGTLTTPGTYTFTVTVTDAVGQTASASYTITVYPLLVITTLVLPGGPPTAPAAAPAPPATSATLTAAPHITGGPVTTGPIQAPGAAWPRPQVIGNPYPAAAAGIPYSYALSASGGLPPYTWALTAGALPPGLSLLPSGLITGIPALAGVYTFAVTVSDTFGQTAGTTFTLIVGPGPLMVATAVLAPATLGAPYSASLAATGGTPLYTWALTGGALPPGIAMDPAPPGHGAVAAGHIVGTPTAPGTYTFTVQVTDSAVVPATATATFTLTVYLNLIIPPAAGPWRILYGPAQPAGGVTGEILQAQNKTITLRTEADQNHEVSFDADGRDPAIAGIAELQTDIIVMYGSQIVFDGRIAPSQDTLTASAHRAVFTALDYREVLRRRAVLPGDQLTWTNVDQATIAWNMIQATQARPGGNLGITRGVGAPTGIQRTYTATLGDYIGDDITALALLDNGFQWQITPYGIADLRLDIFYPAQGTSQNAVLAYGDARISSITRAVDPSTFADAVYVTGDPAFNLTAQLLEAAGLASRPEGRWDSVVATSDNTQLVLNARAAALLAQGQVLTPSYTVTFYPGAWGGPSDIWLGDTVTLQIDSGRLQVNTAVQVVEMAFAISADNVETLTLTVGQIPFRVNRALAKVIRQLKHLGHGIVPRLGLPR